MAFGVYLLTLFSWKFDSRTHKDEAVIAASREREIGERVSIKVLEAKSAYGALSYYKT